MLKKHAFTLIEMLIVVAIIAVLAALLSPALQKALRATRAVACMNNLRQIGTWGMTYANDWQGILPIHNDSTVNTYNFTDSWVGLMRNDGIAQDLRTGAGLVCGELLTVHGDKFRRNNASGCWGSYSLNSRLGGAKIRNKKNEEIAPRMRLLNGRKFWFSDGKTYDNGLEWGQKFDVHCALKLVIGDVTGTSKKDGPWTWMKSSEVDSYGNAFNPHGGHRGMMDSNFLFGDGRVAARSYNDFFAWSVTERQTFVGVDDTVK